MSETGKVELGPEAARRLKAREGDEIRVRGYPLLVAGVRDRPPEGLGMGLFTSLATAQQILERPGQINAMRLGGCWCRFDVPALGKQVEKLLPGSRAITVAGVLKAQKETVATMKRYSLTLYAVGMLLVGGAVVALISSQVRRSLREFGLLLAVGASTTRVCALLVFNGALVGAAGGALGFAMGIPLTSGVGSRLLQVPLRPPPGLWLPVVVLCILVSVLAALVPAWRAARLDPSRVLRED
jgi:ABC-type lipoprotein release transport system permease subunit